MLCEGSQRLKVQPEILFSKGEKMKIRVITKDGQADECEIRAEFDVSVGESGELWINYNTDLPCIVYARGEWRRFIIER